MECVRDQHLEEITEFIQDIEQALESRAVSTVYTWQHGLPLINPLPQQRDAVINCATIKQCLKALDPRRVPKVT